MKSDSPAAELVAISESDVVELARYIASQSGRESASVESHSDCAHDPFEFFCIQDHALDTMSARLRFAVHSSTI
jgi:hypothetical protein